MDGDGEWSGVVVEWSGVDGVEWMVMMMEWSGVEWSGVEWMDGWMDGWMEWMDG